MLARAGCSTASEGCWLIASLAEGLRPFVEHLVYASHMEFDGNDQLSLELGEVLVTTSHLGQFSPRMPHGGGEYAKVSVDVRHGTGEDSVMTNSFQAACEPGGEVESTIRSHCSFARFPATAKTPATPSF